jgi:hypothetical protein
MTEVYWALIVAGHKLRPLQVTGLSRNVRTPMEDGFNISLISQ